MKHKTSTGAIVEVTQNQAVSTYHVTGLDTVLNWADFVPLINKNSTVLVFLFEKCVIHRINFGSPIFWRIDQTGIVHFAFKNCVIKEMVGVSEGMTVSSESSQMAFANSVLEKYDPESSSSFFMTIDTYNSKFPSNFGQHSRLRYIALDDPTYIRIMNLIRVLNVTDVSTGASDVDKQVFANIAPDYLLAAPYFDLMKMGVFRAKHLALDQGLIWR